MRHWIDIVEAALSAELLDKVSPFTARGQANADKIERLQKQIDAEEQNSISNVPVSLQHTDEQDEQAWRTDMELLKMELDKKKQSAMRLLRAQRQKAQEIHQAKMDGYAQAGKAEWEDYYDKVKQQVSTLADKHMSTTAKQGKAIAAMAKRQLKK